MSDSIKIAPSKYTTGIFILVQKEYKAMELSQILIDCGYSVKIIKKEDDYYDVVIVD